MDETTLTRTLRDLAAHPPLHTSPATDARHRARRLQNQHRFAAAFAAVVLAAGAFGVRDLAAGSTHTTAGATAHVLTIAQVKYEAVCSPDLPAVPGEINSYGGAGCYGLEPPAMTVTPASTEALHDSALGWVLQVHLDAADTKAFGVLTARVTPLAEPLNQLAFVLDGVVLSAPSIQSAIDSGTVEIFGGPGTAFTKADVDKLAAELKE